MFMSLRARAFVAVIRRSLRRPAMVIVFVAALVGATTLGFAAATTAGVIYACVNNSSGTIHIVTATTVCATNEVALSWNTEGPQGATGATGSAGPTGGTGPSGATTVYTVRFGGMFPGTSVARAFCEPGEKVAGGGGLATNPSSAGLTQNHPIKDAGGEIAGGTNATGWQVASEGFGDVQAYVICAS